MAAAMRIESSPPCDASPSTPGRSSNVRHPFTMRWLQENLEIDKAQNVPRSVVYDLYTKAAIERNEKPINTATFGKAVRAIFPTVSTRRLGVRGASQYHYSGIRVRNLGHHAHVTTPLSAPRPANPKRESRPPSPLQLRRPSMNDLGELVLPQSACSTGFPSSQTISPSYHCSNSIETSDSEEEIHDDCDSMDTDEEGMINDGGDKSESSFNDDLDDESMDDDNETDNNNNRDTQSNQMNEPEIEYHLCDEVPVPPIIVPSELLSPPPVIETVYRLPKFPDVPSYLSSSEKGLGPASNKTRGNDACQAFGTLYHRHCEQVFNHYFTGDFSAVFHHVLNFWRGGAMKEFQHVYNKIDFIPFVIEYDSLFFSAIIKVTFKSDLTLRVPFSLQKLDQFRKKYEEVLSDALCYVSDALRDGKKYACQVWSSHMNHMMNLVHLAAQQCWIANPELAQQFVKEWEHTTHMWPAYQIHLDTVFYGQILSTVSECLKKGTKYNSWQVLVNHLASSFLPITSNTDPSEYRYKAGKILLEFCNLITIRVMSINKNAILQDQAFNLRNFLLEQMKGAILTLLSRLELRGLSSVSPRPDRNLLEAFYPVVVFADMVRCHHRNPRLPCTSASSMSSSSSPLSGAASNMYRSGSTGATQTQSSLSSILFLSHHEAMPPIPDSRLDPRPQFAHQPGFPPPYQNREAEQAYEKLIMDDEGREADVPAWAGLETVSNDDTHLSQ